MFREFNVTLVCSLVVVAGLISDPAFAQTPEEALAGRLVRSVHAVEELLPAATALAREIADNASPVSVALTRQMMWRMLGEDHPMAAHRVDSRAIMERGRSADAAEGVASFLEKRPANFTLGVANDLPDIFPNWVEPEFS